MQNKLHYAAHGQTAAEVIAQRADAGIDWPYSSFHRYVTAGICAPDWGQSVPDLMGVAREQGGVVGLRCAKPTYGAVRGVIFRRSG